MEHLSGGSFECPAHKHHLAARVDAGQKASLPQTAAETLLAYREAYFRYSRDDVFEGRAGSGQESVTLVTHLLPELHFVSGFMNFAASIATFSWMCSTRRVERVPSSVLDPAGSM
jgi:hypothetical protein